MILNLMKTGEVLKKGRKTKGKGEIAHYEFLLLPQCFQKSTTADA